MCVRALCVTLCDCVGAEECAPEHCVSHSVTVYVLRGEFIGLHVCARDSMAHTVTVYVLRGKLIGLIASKSKQEVFKGFEI